MIWCPLIQNIHIFEVRKFIDKKTHVISVFLFFFITTNPALPMLLMIEKKNAFDQKRLPAQEKKQRRKQQCPHFPLTHMSQTNMIPITDCCVWKGLEIKTDLCQFRNSHFSIIGCPIKKWQDQKLAVNEKSTILVQSC